MSQGKHQTRRERARAEQQDRERKQRLRFGGIALVVTASLVFFLWLGNRPKAADQDVPTGADQNAWGPVDAPVVIEDWSDFN